MIRFEEHEGQLFRMLEEPVPLPTDAKLPCLVRLIQDDSPMGRYNRDAAYFDVIGKLFVAQKIKENPFYSNTLHAYEKNSLNQDYCIASIHTLEIIGYPVVEGSHWWALWQMQNGKAVRNTATGFKFVLRNDLICHVCEEKTGFTYTVDDWLNGAAKSGWQLYKKPEPAKEPIADCDNCKHRCTKSNIDYCQMYEPKPTFKVGDWVEHEKSKEQGRITYISSGNYGAIEVKLYDQDELEAYTKSDFNANFRKLSPSEVIVKIGCLSGTVDAAVILRDTFYLRHSDGSHSLISSTALDTHTRELVDSLLKAREEE